MTDQGRKNIGLTVALGSLAGIIYGISPDYVVSFLSETAASKVAQYGFFFTLAAWIHAGRVKKEISNQFSPLTEAINNVASTLKDDLAMQAERLDTMEKNFTGLTIRVDRLEQPKGV